MISNFFGILDNYWLINRSFPLIEMGKSSKALVNFLNLVILSLLLLYIIYINYLFLLNIKILAWENKVWVNVRWY